MNLLRSLTRYSSARTMRGAGADYSLARALSLLLVPWRKR